MAMHDANFSEHFDDGEKTNGSSVEKKMSWKTRKAITGMSNSPPAPKKTSRKRKSLIPIGKEVGGYKKHQRRGLKKSKAKAKVKESEPGKTLNKEPCGSKTEEDEYFIYKIDYERLEKNIDKWGSYVRTFSPEEEEEEEDRLRRKIPISREFTMMIDVGRQHPDGEFGERERWVNDYFRSWKNSYVGMYGPASNGKLAESFGDTGHWSWSEEEYNQILGLTDHYSKSGSGSSQKTPI